MWTEKLEIDCKSLKTLHNFWKTIKNTGNILKKLNYGDASLHNLLVYGHCIASLRCTPRDQSLHLLTPSDVCQHYHRHLRKNGVVFARRRCSPGQIHARLLDLAENHALAAAGLWRKEICRNEHEYQKSQTESQQHEVSSVIRIGYAWLIEGQHESDTSASDKIKKKNSLTTICNLIFSTETSQRSIESIYISFLGGRQFSFEESFTINFCGGDLVNILTVLGEKFEGKMSFFFFKNIHHKTKKQNLIT